MKKILLATTVLAMSSTLAAAEISFSGFGQAGLSYVENRAVETQIDYRMRININGSVETDAGVKFGGRIRIQSDEGDADSVGSVAYLYAEMSGFRVEVGNSNTALDSAGLYYASEIGYLDRSFGDNQSDIATYESKLYSPADRMGLFVSYEAGDFVGRLSYVDPDQASTGDAEDIQVSADYTFGAVSLSAGYADNANFGEFNTVAFVGAQYAFNDVGNVGVLYYDNNVTGTLFDYSIGTVYGNYTFGATTVAAYVANSDYILNTTDTAYGIGASYDLGGARAAFDLHSDYTERTFASVGVRFDF